VSATSQLDHRVVQLARFQLFAEQCPRVPFAGIFSGRSRPHTRSSAAYGADPSTSFAQCSSSGEIHHTWQLSIRSPINLFLLSSRRHSRTCGGTFSIASTYERRRLRPAASFASPAADFVLPTALPTLGGGFFGGAWWCGGPIIRMFLGICTLSLRVRSSPTACGASGFAQGHGHARFGVVSGR